MARKTNKTTSRKAVKNTRTNQPDTASSLQSTAVPAAGWMETASRWVLPALFLFLLLGLVIRILNLSELSLWMDEYVHVMRAKRFIDGEGPLLTDDNNGILLTICLLPGFALFGGTAFWARFPSVLFGLGLIYVVYRLGERLFNRFVGLFAASGAALSLFLVFWSRVCRNYAPLVFFYLLLLLLFWVAVERRSKPGDSNWWVRNGISRREALLFPAVGILSLLSHQLTFFIVFTIAVYSLVRLAFTFTTEAEKSERRKFAWLTSLTAPFLLVVFIPPLGEALRTGLSPFLLSNIADWAIPDWDRLAGLSRDLPLDAFHLYSSLMQYDLGWLYVPALTGLAAGLWLRPRAGLWLCCGFVVPFLLMSFLFREPFLRRYLIFVYPLLFLSAGVFFYTIWHWLHQKWPKGIGAAGKLLFPLPFLLLLGNAHWSEIGDLALARKLEGHIVDTRIASWSFTNWKEACAYVKAQRQPDDLLIATVPTAVSYYLEHEQVLWFRQVYFDTHTKQYKLNP
ncbi:MAG: hypothetical protein EP344_14910, partial [Bacteroidetes bacterium]